MDIDRDQCRWHLLDVAGTCENPDVSVVDSRARSTLRVKRANTPESGIWNRKGAKGTKENKKLRFERRSPQREYRY
jgi:hypothetical protein